METEKFFIQFLEFGLNGCKCLLHGFCSCAGDNHNQEFLFFIFYIFGGEVGRKTKTKTVSVEENLDLGKNRKGNLGLSKFWTLSKGQGSKKWGF